MHTSKTDIKRHELISEIEIAFTKVVKIVKSYLIHGKTIANKYMYISARKVKHIQYRHNYYCRFFFTFYFRYVDLIFFKQMSLNSMSF